MKMYYYENLLTVKGPVEDINKFKQAAYLNDEYYFSAEKLRPTPQGLPGTGKSNLLKLYSLKCLKSLYENEVPQCVEHLVELENSIEEAQIIIDNFQYTWVTWHIVHWGPKFDLYLRKDVVKHEWLYDIRTELPFDSEGMPPLPLFDYVSEQFPSLKFKLVYFESKTNFCGCCKWEHGKRVDGKYEEATMPIDWATEHFNCTEESYNEMISIREEDKNETEE